MASCFPSSHFPHVFTVVALHLSRVLSHVTRLTSHSPIVQPPENLLLRCCCSGQSLLSLARVFSHVTRQDLLRCCSDFAATISSFPPFCCHFRALTLLLVHPSTVNQSFVSSIDKSRITNPNRRSDEYQQGLISFIEMCKAYVDIKGYVRCACAKCQNSILIPYIKMKYRMHVYGICWRYRK
ncbi:hypothetical protein E3N88_29797 [Mikania micrantha]|uniref:Uncharacterized protein n=1 Tax=Mikania micrantha TaxID=192012 RepID=A0A5N6MMQ2_9ASTR|nr:hypothetical protein E3N88_29797 [Mikania micrantha]